VYEKQVIGKKKNIDSQIGKKNSKKKSVHAAFSFSFMFSFSSSCCEGFHFVYFFCFCF